MTAPTFNVRASSFGDLLDCAHRWEAVHILGMTAPVSARAQLGTALHASTAAFDIGRMERSGVTAKDTAAVLVDTLRNPEREVRWDETPEQLEKIGIPLHRDYCLNWSPRWDFRAVELKVGQIDIEVGDVVIRLTGTMDRSRIRQAAGLGINDLKSGRTAVDRNGRAVTKGHVAQLGVYELLAERKLGVQVTEPAEIIGLKTAGNLAIGTGEIVGAKDRLIGTAEEPGLLQMAASMLSAGLFPPNPKSMLCSEKYCPRWAKCKFHD